MVVIFSLVIGQQVAHAGGEQILKLHRSIGKHVMHHQDVASENGKRHNGNVLLNFFRRDREVGIFDFAQRKF